VPASRHNKHHTQQNNTYTVVFITVSKNYCWK